MELFWSDFHSFSSLYGVFLSDWKTSGNEGWVNEWNDGKWYHLYMSVNLEVEIIIKIINYIQLSFMKQHIHKCFSPYSPRFHLFPPIFGKIRDTFPLWCPNSSQTFSFLFICVFFFIILEGSFEIFSLHFFTYNEYNYGTSQCHDADQKRKFQNSLYKISTSDEDNQVMWISLIHPVK